ncbi:MAG TPA: ATP-binding protein, partial [Ferruginibacter sp.]|nr:ATP-binding protein [Ferruginibacter sp.]
LMGEGVTFYIGNNDGSFWTDMARPVPNPPNIIKESNKYFEYDDPKGVEVLAAVQPIPNSDWQVLIEYSKQSMTEGATRFLKWLIIIGGLLLVAGIFIAWLMSHNIIKPLKQLTKAATGIAKGDYSLPVEVDRDDELGELANSFNVMQEKIHANQLNLEQKVLERTAQLESVNSELEAFSYSVSHDLRAPLRGIMGFTTILEEEYSSKLDDEARRITGVIKANTQKMGNLIDDLLTFSRMGRNDIVKTTINTRDMVNEVISGIPKNKEGKIKWVTGALTASYADSNTIRQVWINLISNAVKYSGQKEDPVIEIGSFPHEGQNAFYIRDNGVGFDKRYKDKLFKVFQRLHNPDEFEGTGIGLAIVEKIISKHGGKVWAEAETGQGASFYFSLPNA